MHFSKTYAQLLLELPPELSDNAIQYRQLKKLINRVVGELQAQGLGPDVLEELLSRHRNGNDTTLDDKELDGSPMIVYEFDGQSGHVEPLLLLRRQPSQQRTSFIEEELEDESQGSTNHSLIWPMQNKDMQPFPSVYMDVDHAPLEAASSDMSASDTDVIIRLASNSEFFTLLSTALQSLSRHSEAVRADFRNNLSDLAGAISNAARPVSHSSSSFHAYSMTEHPGVMRKIATNNKTDLYFWREIFQLYVETEVFETVNGLHGGALPVEESEERLRLFAERVTVRGLSDKCKLKSTQSRAALETFLQLNLFILNVKKFQLANTEAARKILKKHAKRTALPLPELPPTEQSDLPHIFSPNTTFTSLPHMLVLAVTEVLLPVVPHIDDYSCLICTGLAYKPVRLGCGHLFCVRCLVTMQKRGQGHCPLCRADTVLVANRSNVDFGLLNFLQDWFPMEATEKMKSNEIESEREMYTELGLDPDKKCTIM